MKIFEELAALKNINFRELDIDSIVGWPLLAKSILCLLLAILLGFSGYYFHLKGMKDNLQVSITQENMLKKELIVKVEQASNLQAYREQMRMMEEAFASLIHQLPSDTEVPSLLEDVTQIGLGAGLEFEAITLQPEITREFFIELPIQIKAVGEYHDIGNFISGVSSLKRIVTLHDFKITPSKTGELSLDILAKTYRYKGNDEDNSNG